MFNESNLPNNVSSRDMRMIMEGDKQDLNNDTIGIGAGILQKLSEEEQLKYENYLNTTVDNVLAGLESETTTYKSISKQKYENVSYGSNFDVGSVADLVIWQTVTSQCISRRLNYAPGQVLLKETLGFSFHQLKKFLAMTVYIHHENQLVRNFGGTGSPRSWVIALNLQKEYRNDSNYIELVINSIQILTKRNDANANCDNGLDDEDSHWMQTASRTAGCIPAYWRRFSKLWKDSLGLKYCKTYEQYKQVADLIDRRWTITTKYDPPCNKMTTMSHAYTARPFDSAKNKIYNDLQLIIIEILYKTDEYQEIINKKAFDRESLFCQVGGYIGIMLGVSFLQLPDILIATFVIIQTKYKQMTDQNNTNSVVPQQYSTQPTQRDKGRPTDNTSQEVLVSNISCLI